MIFIFFFSLETKRIHKAGWETAQGLNLRFPVAKQVWANSHPTLQPPRARSQGSAAVEAPYSKFCPKEAPQTSSAPRLLGEKSQFNTRTRKVCASEGGGDKIKIKKIPILVAAGLESGTSGGEGNIPGAGGD